MTVDNETFFALVEEQLAAGGQVRIPLVGTSMRPTLLAGDVIVLESVAHSSVSLTAATSPILGEESGVKVGDVVLFRYLGRHLLHRIVEIEGDRYTMRGDNCTTTETARREDIVARMVGAEKKHPLRHLAVRWLGHKGRKQLRPWYFVALAILMWAPLNGFGVPLDEYVLGLRLDHLLHASVFIPCALFIYTPHWRKWAVWATAVGVGVLTETVQWLLPYRGFDINDLVANFLGVSLGWAIILIIKRKYKTR